MKYTALFRAITTLFCLWTASMAQGQNRQELKWILEQDIDSTTRLIATTKLISKTRDSTEAVTLIRSAYQLNETVDSSDYFLEILSKEAAFYQRIWYTDTAEKLYRKLKTLALKKDASVYKGEADYGLAYIAHRYLLKDSVLNLCNQSIQEFATADYSLGLSKARRIQSLFLPDSIILTKDDLTPISTQRASSLYKQAQQKLKSKEYLEAMHLYSLSDDLYAACIESQLASLPALIKAGKIKDFKKKVQQLDRLLSDSGLENEYRGILLNHIMIIGIIHQYEGSVFLATEVFNTHLLLAEKYQDYLEIVSVHFHLAELYKSFGTAEQYHRYLHITRDLARLHRQPNAFSRSEMMIGEYFEDREVYDSAILYYMSSFRFLSTKEMEEYNLGYLSYRIHTTLQKLGMTDSSFFFLQLAEKNSRIAGDHQVQSFITMDQANLAYQSNNYEQAIDNYRAAILLAEKDGYIEGTLEGWKRLYDIYKSQKDFQSANHALENYTSVKEIFDNNNNAIKVAQRELTYTLEKEKEIQRQKELSELLIREQREKSLRTLIYGLIIFSILLLAIAFVMYQNFRDKKKSNILLAEQNEKINKQRVELEALNQMKSDFFANISHELRTPLTLVNAPLQEIDQHLNAAANPTVKENLQLMQKSTKQLQRLVDDILDLSRAESNKITLQEHEVFLDALLHRIWNNFHTLADLLSIKYQVDLKGIEPVQIRVDVKKVEKILNNLLSNAFKFCKKQDAITLSAWTDRNQLYVTVKDTGAGIRPEDVPFIFDRYFRGDQSGSTHLQSSTGIGLALSKEFTNLMGGQLSVESKLGEGSTFRLILPIQIIEKGNK